MDNNGRGGGNRMEMGRAGGWAGVGGKGRKLYLNNKIFLKKKIKKIIIMFKANPRKTS